MQGYYFYERNTNKDADMATQYYERATQLDPSYALAWVGLSRARYWQADKGLIPTEEGQRLADVYKRQCTAFVAWMCAQYTTAWAAQNFYRTELLVGVGQAFAFIDVYKRQVGDWRRQQARCASCGLGNGPHDATSD